MNEIWKDIKGYEQLYQVSNLGRVKRITTGKILKPNVVRNYFRIRLCKEGCYKNISIHRLVYETFVGEIPEGMQVNHINERKNDNRLENLNLMTPKQNTNWGTRNERIVSKNTNGIRSKPVLQYDLDGNLIKEWPSVSEIERKLGFYHISCCCLGKYKTAYGYIWKYKKAG